MCCRSDQIRHLTMKSSGRSYTVGWVLLVLASGSTKNVQKYSLSTKSWYSISIKSSHKEVVARHRH